MNRAPVIAAVVALAVSVACQPTQRQPQIRLNSEHMEFTITSDPIPPRARELGGNRYKVIIRDRDTRQPLDGGEGQIYAQNRDGLRAYAPLERGEELGTYYASLHFVTAGDWAMAVRFRRDSTQPLEKVDWMQQVFAPTDER